MRLPVRRFIAAGLFAATLAFLYLQLFIPPFTPIWRGYDESCFLYHAQRMLEGQMPYRDFFQFHPPGLNVLNFGLLKLIGSRLWIPNVMVVLLGISLSLVCLSISRKVIEGPTAYLPPALFLLSAFRFAMEATHHAYSILAAMGAVALVMGSRTRTRLAGAGALFGLAACFTQTHGLLGMLALAVFLLWEHRHTEDARRRFFRDAVYLLCSFFAAILVVNAYFVWQSGWQSFLYGTVEFVLRYWSSLEPTGFQAYWAAMPPAWPWRNIPKFGLWLFINALIPGVYALFFLRYRREAARLPREKLAGPLWLALLGLFLFAGVAPSPRWYRLCFISMPGLVLFVWMIHSSARLRRYLVPVLWLFLLLLPIGATWERQGRWRASLRLPAGRAAFLEPVLHEKYLWVLQNTRPSDFFFQAGHCDLYFPFGLKNPTPHYYLSPTEFTRPEHVQEIVAALEQHQVQFLFCPLEYIAPRDENSRSDHLGPFRDYVRGRYRVLKTFEDFDQVWVRKAAE